MSDARELLEQYGLEDPADGDFGKVTVEECAPRAFDALRAVLDLIDGCETAETVSEGTILSAAVKIRMGAYKRVRDAITSALAGESDG